MHLVERNQLILYLYLPLLLFLNGYVSLGLRETEKTQKTLLKLLKSL